MIKVVGGKYRSRNLLTPEEGTLPSKNMVRGAMISALMTSIKGARVLDLFAGSGALGIEALSQGAAYCVFVDVNKKAAEVVKKNLSTLKEENAAVYNQDYLSYLSSSSERFDIVFLDPPYAMKESYQKAVSALLEKGMLSPDASIVLEYEGELEIDTAPFGFTRDYKYGKTKVKLLRNPL